MLLIVLMEDAGEVSVLPHDADVEVEQTEEISGAPPEFGAKRIGSFGRAAADECSECALSVSVGVCMRVSTAEADSD